MSRYAGKPEVIGRRVVVNGAPATVVGVMPAAFEFPYREGVWQPLSLQPGLLTQRRDNRTLTLFGRLAEHISAQQARGELESLGASLRQQYPETNTDVVPTAVRFGEQQVGRLGDAPPPLFMAATALLVLLIACSNVANLLLARSAGRAREMAIRTAVGGTRGRLVQQLLVESVLLACAAGCAGLWLSRVGVQFVSQAFGRNVPYWMQFTIDGRVVAVVMTVCVVTSLVCGLAPALFVSKTDVHGLMKEGGRAGMAPRVRRGSTALIAAQVALTMILLAAAGVMVRSYLVLYGSDRVLDASQVLTLELRPPEHTDRTPPQRADAYAELDDRLMTVPGVPVTTVASTRPFVRAPRRALSLAGDASGARAPGRSVSTVAIGARYFDALGIRLLRGRSLTGADGRPGHESAVVNQRFVDAYFPNEDPIGQRIRVADEGTVPAGPWLSIVGISPTIRQGVASAPAPVVYLPLRTYEGPEAALIVGGLRDPAAVTPLLRRAIDALAPGMDVFNVRPLQDVQSDSRLLHRLLGTLRCVCGRRAAA